MNTFEFSALAKDDDLTKVVITCYRDSYTTVSAVLRCDIESQGLTAYNSLRDSRGYIMQFDLIDEAEKMIRHCGYTGRITMLGSGEKAAKSQPEPSTKQDPYFSL